MTPEELDAYNARCRRELATLRMRIRNLPQREQERQERDMMARHDRGRPVPIFEQNLRDFERTILGSPWTTEAIYHGARTGRLSVSGRWVPPQERDHARDTISMRQTREEIARRQGEAWNDFVIRSARERIEARRTSGNIQQSDPSDPAEIERTLRDQRIIEHRQLRTYMLAAGYGMGAERLAQSAGVSAEEAIEPMDGWDAIRISGPARSSTSSVSMRVSESLGYVRASTSEKETTLTFGTAELARLAIASALKDFPELREEFHVVERVSVLDSTRRIKI